MTVKIQPSLSDGRALTSYYSACELNKYLMMKHNITNDYQYRMQLQNRPMDFDRTWKTTVDFLKYHGVSTCPSQSALPPRPTYQPQQQQRRF